MNSAAKILDRLRRVKQLRDDSWAAACPVCDSQKGRPISIRATDDSRVLIHAFCGCETEAVLSAVGLVFSDLFDRPIAHPVTPIRGGFSARELLELASHELTVGAILLSDAETRPLSPDDFARLALAAARVGKAQGISHGG